MTCVTKTYVAVVDDDESICRSFGRLLRAAGLQPVSYNSAESFLADTKHSQFGCLVLDIQLGGISGIELAQRLSAIGLSISEETLKKRPTFGLSLLLEPGRLDKFLEAFDWMLTEIKKVEIKEDSDQPADRPEGALPENSEYGTPA